MMKTVWFVCQYEMAYVKNDKLILAAWYPPDGTLFAPQCQRILETTPIEQIEKQLPAYLLNIRE